MRIDAFSKCHPLTNFLFFFGAIGFGVVIQHPAYILLSLICGMVYYLLMKGVSGMKTVVLFIPLFIFITIINPVFNHYGEIILFLFFGNPYTLEALFYGMAVAGIFVVMMVWFLCCSLVLTSDKFICLFGSLIPSLSMVLVMVLRMIPNLIKKAAQISAARKSIGRGAGEQSTNREKLLDGMGILSGLTDWALEGSIVTADSMRSRGYGSARRSSFRKYLLSEKDVFLIIFMAALAVSVLLFGGFDAAYTPQVAITKVGPGLVVYGIYLLIPTIMYGKEALRWYSSILRI